MHSLHKQFMIFGKSLGATDIKQGKLGDCYFLTAIASLAEIRKGQIIKDAFVTKKDNSKHVYITRWNLEGKTQFVSVDDKIPGNKGKAIMSTTFGDHDFWPVILEKAFAKIHRSYQNIEEGYPNQVWAALTQAPTYIYFNINKKFLLI